MTLPRHANLADVGADPFGERPSPGFSLQRRLLGGDFLFHSDSEALLALVAAAYDDLPEPEWQSTPPTFHVELRLAPPRASMADDEPPPVRTQSGAGMLCGVMDESNYVVVLPALRQALVVASGDRVAQGYHARYELIEFAVFMLAGRSLGLVPLHAACLARRGRAVLLLGRSGAGKSTLALHGWLDGLDLLAEDAVFVGPHDLIARGVPNFLHLRTDAEHWTDDAATRAWITQAPVIRRRSGVEKFEADLRCGPGRLTTGPVELASAVFVSPQAPDAEHPLLRHLADAEAHARLAADQPYAVGQPGWAGFSQRLQRCGIHELRRPAHPHDAVAALRRLLD